MCAVCFIDLFMLLILRTVPNYNSSTERAHCELKICLHTFQLHRRVAECVKTLHVLEELNLGQYSSEQQIRKKLLLGDDFDWSQLKVFSTFHKC